MSDSNKLTSKELTSIRRYLADRFNLDELKTLASNIGIDYQNLPHGTKEIFALELLAYVQRKHSTQELLESALQDRNDTEIVRLLEQLKDSPNNPSIEPTSQPQSNNPGKANKKFFLMMLLITPILIIAVGAVVIKWVLQPPDHTCDDYKPPEGSISLAVSSKIAGDNQPIEEVVAIPSFITALTDYNPASSTAYFKELLPNIMDSCSRYYNYRIKINYSKIGPNETRYYAVIEKNKV